ncbi:GIY-YIG nuclease family protein [Kangiella sediminilitoris]|uniref:GIY-YIG domain-containing protein n=1 Tax=Kangiella sediminilitoris TaxID=1144748 RepID=A0A1B3B9N0_9GAMM|nr:GIY-YIG nuclease family protein [Kangiella sediminilitoris]AOE49513.1 hypothetical protein KS2013_789 [Kangiella sediminilitoris]
MNTKNFQILKFSQIKDSGARSISLKQEAAVYAWYRGFDELYHEASGDKLYDEINKLLNAKLSAQFNGKLGYLYELQIQEVPAALSPKKKALLKDICGSSRERRDIVNLINMASEFQSPLYVGKAVNLRKRIGDHCEGLSSLTSRLEKAGIELDSCFIKFKYIKDTNDPKTISQLDEKTLLIEEIITKLSPAAFVKRPG